MPSVIQGFVITTKPKDVTLESFPTVDTIATGATTSIVYPSLSFHFTYDCFHFSTSFSLSAGAQFNVNDQNIVSVKVTAGAAGVTDVVAQVAPTLLTTERQRFALERG